MKNEVQIFDNPDFGKIRTVMIDDEPWFVAKDISSYLGYVKPSNMVKLVDEEDKKTITSSVLEPEVKKQSYNISIINESGLYAAIFGSKQENAKKFKRWVTSEVLPSLRKTGSYSSNQIPMTTEEKIKLLAQGNVELREEIKSVRNDLESFKMEMPIFGEECSSINVAVREKVVECLGGKNTAAYQNKELHRKLYQNIYSQTNRYFGVRIYKSIKRKDFAEYLRVVSEYQPPLGLKSLIDSENAQEVLKL